MATIKTPVLVTGLCDSMSLCVIRSLSKKGINTVAVDSTIDSFYGKTKYGEKIKCESLYNKTLIDDLIDISRKFTTKPVLINCTDQSVLITSKYYDEISKYYYLISPKYDVITGLMSKKNLHDFIDKHKFYSPKTYISESHSDLVNIIEKVSYPCIVKPEYRDEYWVKNLPSKVLKINSKNEFYNILKKYYISERVLVTQEWIDGGDDDIYYCLTYIGKNKNPLASFVGRKIRQYPRGIGSTAVAESVENSYLARESIRFLLEANCVGFNSVEYKYSKINNKFYVIEPTIGRPDTQEGSSVACGLDIPYIAYNDAIGIEQEYISKYKYGVRWVNEPLDFYAIRKDYGVGDGLKDRLIDHLKFKKGYGLFDISDIKPFTSFAINLIKQKISRL
jgi:D-aspartate ligase